MDMDGISLTIGGAALTTLGGIIGAVIKAYTSRNQRTEITPSPLSIEQTAYQAAMKDNNRDHENLFSRMSSVEKDVAAIKADNVAQNRILDRMADQIEKLYDRIICGGKKVVK